MQDAKERPHWKRTLAVLGVTVRENQTAIANAFNSLSRLVIGGIGAQVAAAVLKSQSIGGSNTPHERAFMIAFGVCALLTAIGAGLALSVPAGNGDLHHD